MPNALVDPSGGTAPLYDPRVERANRSDYARDYIADLDKANSFYESGGRWPSVGWILVKRADYNNINPYAINLSLQLEDSVSGTSITLNNLSVVQARCVSRGVASDPAAVYLVQLTYSRGVVYNPWFQFPVYSPYNVRAPGYPGVSPTDPSQYYSRSLNSGVIWTWDSMLGDLWGQMASLIGPYPGLPGSPMWIGNNPSQTPPALPTGTPENYTFEGVSCWSAVNEVLDFLGMAVSADLTQATPYDTVVSGASDLQFSAFQSAFVELLEDDEEWIDAGAGRIPAQVIVYFVGRYQYFGTEETVTNGDNQWTTVASVKVTVPSPFGVGVGTAYLWADYTPRLDKDGTPLPADNAMAQTIANERAQQFYQRVTRQTAGFMRQVYTGVLPFSTGSLVDGVRWRQTGLESADGKLGWQTEIIRGYYFDEVTFSMNAKGLTGPK